MIIITTIVICRSHLDAPTQWPYWLGPADYSGTRPLGTGVWLGVMGVWRSVSQEGHGLWFNSPETSLAMEIRLKDHSEEWEADGVKHLHKEAEIRTSHSLSTCPGTGSLGIPSQLLSDSAWGKLWLAKARLDARYRWEGSWEIPRSPWRQGEGQNVRNYQHMLNCARDTSVPPGTKPGVYKRHGQL